jgi:vancomycin resistance protein YoaR
MPVLAEAATGNTGLSLLTILISTVGVLLLIAGGVGTWAAMRVGKNTQVVANYKASAESWESRANALKEQVEGLKGELGEVKANATREKQQSGEVIAALQAKVATLQDLVTGQHAVEVLTNRVDDRFNDISDRIESLAIGQQMLIGAQRDRRDRPGTPSGG